MHFYFLNSRGYNEVAYDYDHLQSNQSKMVNSGWFFVNAQETYGVNALLAFCMGLLESGWGRSSIAINKNNLFGWNAVDSNPSGSADKYDNIESAVTQHMAVNLRGYLDINDARFFGSHLGNKGSGFNVKYASDPYWGLKISALAYQPQAVLSKQLLQFLFPLLENNSSERLHPQHTVKIHKGHLNHRSAKISF